LSLPTEDPALTGRCYRRLIAPLSGPIKDQDLVSWHLRLSEPARQVAEAFSLVAAAFSLIPIRLGLIVARRAKLVHAAEDVSVPEIILGLMKMMPGLRTIMPGLTKFMPGLGEVFGGVTACSMPTPGCLQTGLLRQKQIRPSVIRRTEMATPSCFHSGSLAAFVAS